MARHNQILEDTVEIPNTTGTDLNNSVQANAQATTPNAYSTVQQPTTQTIQQPKANLAQNTTNVVKSNTQVTNNQNEQTNVSTFSTSLIPVEKPSDFYDQTVQGYLDDYQYGVSINDYQAQINALTALDDYRVSKGYKALYTDNIYELVNQRTNKIKNQISQYENQMAYANSIGDYDTVQALGQQLETYKKSVNYVDKPNNGATYMMEQSYESDYNNVLNGIVNELLTMRFTYNPNEDEALIKAQEYAVNTAYESMNARGILDSTMTAQIVASTIANLQVQYQKMAKEEFYEDVDRLITMANFVLKLDDAQYQRWQENTQFNYQKYEVLKDEMEYQWKRVEQLGYVDNNASIVLGVPVGTLSASTRKAISDAQAEAQAEYNKLYSDIALAEAKAQINAQYEVQTYATKKAIDTQYGGSSVGSSGLTNVAGAYNEIANDSKFNGKLSASALKSQMELMEQEEAVLFAAENAKDYSSWIEGISSIGLTPNEANEILTAGNTERNMNYVTQQYESGQISLEQYKEWCESYGIDWIPTTNEYKVVRKAMDDNSQTAESEMKVFANYLDRGLNDEVGNRLYEELKEAYRLTDEQMMKMLDRVRSM